jgi:hypothetical protein
MKIDRYWVAKNRDPNKEMFGLVSMKINKVAMYSK